MTEFYQSLCLKVCNFGLQTFIIGFIDNENIVAFSNALRIFTSWSWSRSLKIFEPFFELVTDLLKTAKGLFQNCCSMACCWLAHTREEEKRVNASWFINVRKRCKVIQKSRRDIRRQLDVCTQMMAECKLGWVRRTSIMNECLVQTLSSF